MSKLFMSVLNEAEIEKVHNKTLDVFEKVGIKITHDETLRILKKAGAKVNESNQIVRFSRELIEELLAKAPSVAYETGLNGKILKAGGNNRYYHSLILDPFICDINGPRRPTLEDVRRHTIIGESLPRISGMMRMQFPVSDIPEPDCYYKTMEVFLCNHTKHTAVYPTSVENCQTWIEVAEVIAETQGFDLVKTPIYSIAMAVTSPLQIHGLNVDIMKMAIKYGFPVIPTVCPMAGTTAPYSLAGTMLIANVESLASVLVVQALKPGHPVFFGAGPSITDMKTGHDLYYTPEKMLFKEFIVQMGKFYNLPISGETGGSMTWRHDQQNGAEGALYMLASVLGGQNIMGGIGSNHNANGMSQEQIIIQCGMLDIVEYVAKGLEINDEELAFDSIRNIGPGGNFLTDELTLKNLRKNKFFDSEYLDLSGGYTADAPGVVEMARKKADELVDNYKPTVPGNVREGIKRYFYDKYSDKKVANL